MVDAGQQHCGLTPDLGGSLGEKTKEQLEKDFAMVAWALEPSTVDSPKYGEVKTGNGYHIVMVEK